MTYETLKMMHLSCAVLSISGFALRGFWMLRASPLLASLPARILPHVIDTLFLLSGISLVVMLGLPVLKLPWLTAKILLLVVYILLGTIALKRGKTRRTRALAFVFALLTFAWIAGIATSKSLAGWLAWTNI